MKIVDRGAWGARAARSSGQYRVSWAARTEFFVHHTDGPRGQTVRSIQDFHMDGRGWADVGYNFLVRDSGAIYEGRGWLVVGAHCPGHNRSGIGVAYIGSNNPTPEAQRSLRWLYEEACRRAGRKLAQRCHGDRYPTECPGSRLRAWVRAGMPADGTAPAALSWMEELVKELPVVGVGDDNYDVKTVRGCVFARGRVPVEAYAGAGLRAWLESTRYDEELAALVRTVQRAEDLDDDGIVGPKTWPALLRV